MPEIFKLLGIFVLIVLIAYIIKLTFFDNKKGVAGSTILQYTEKNATEPSVIGSSELNKKDTTGAGDQTPSVAFCYSIWLYIDDWNYKYGDLKPICSRSNTGSPFTDACPLIALGKYQNNIEVHMLMYPPHKTQTKSLGVMGTPSDSFTCTISNVPLQKWVNFTVSVLDRTIDMYLDGKLVRTCEMPNLPKINPHFPLNVTPDGGFSGKTAGIQHWSRALSPHEVYEVYKKGDITGLDKTSAPNDVSVKLSVVKDGKTQASLKL